MVDPESNVAWVDTIDVCHLKCPTCIRGVRGMQNTSRKMDLAFFETVAARLRQQGFHRIGFFNWTEPFLNSNLQDYVAAAKRAGFFVLLSSTLSIPHIENLESTFAAGLDQLTVSISGLDQETYQINHVGGDLKYVFNNLNRVREIIDRRALPLHVDVRFLRFYYNGHQAPQIREYAESMRFRFEILDASGDPKTNWMGDHDDARYVREAKMAADKPSPEDQGKACELLFNQIAIDCEGDVYLCCCWPNFPSLRIGKFLEMTDDEILVARFFHPFCRACTMPRRERTAAEEARLQAAIQNTVLS